MGSRWDSGVTGERGWGNEIRMILAERGVLEGARRAGRRVETVRVLETGKRMFIYRRARLRCALAWEEISTTVRAK